MGDRELDLQDEWVERILCGVEYWVPESSTDDEYQFCRLVGDEAADGDLMCQHSREDVIEKGIYQHTILIDRLCLPLRHLIIRRGCQPR